MPFNHLRSRGSSLSRIQQVNGTKTGELADFVLWKELTEVVDLNRELLGQLLSLNFVRVFAIDCKCVFIAVMFNCSTNDWV